MHLLPAGKFKKRERGQALLLVLLSMAAVLTVVLSATSRTITDVSVTTSEEDALRAFSAAEAGVEKVLLTGNDTSGSPDPIDNSVSFDAVVSTNPEGREFVYPAPLKAGESATFWFAGKDINNNFTCTSPLTCLKRPQISDLCWGVHSSSAYSNNNDKPAVLLSVYYDDTSNVLSGDYSNIKVARIGFDPNSGRTSSNHFSGVSGGTCNIGGKTFQYHASGINFRNDLNLPPGCHSRDGCLLLAKVRVFYSNPSNPEQIAIAFDGNPRDTLPAQGKLIESIGSAGEATRKLNVFQSFAEPPSIFDSAVFSLSDFAKN